MPPGARLGQWLFRFGRDERLPVVLTQRRIFILPTGAGLLFATVLVVMLIGAINYNLSLGHALVFLLAGMGLVGMLHTFRNLLALRLWPGRAEAVFAGEIAYFPLFVENPRSEARIALDFAFDKAAGVHTDISPASKVSILLPCPTTQRGRLDPGRITLSSRYPLGLFHAWSYPHPAFACIVYPQALDTPLPPATLIADKGYRQGESGQEDFSGLRERQPSDPPRHIAWKAAARDFPHRPLLVKQFAGGADEELWLDWALTPAERDSETRLSILTGWVLAAEARGVRYGLALPAGRIAPAQGHAHRNACLEALALHGQEDT